MRTNLLGTILIAIALACPLMAGITGKIAGRVTDAETGEPLVGVNVYIEELAIGATTDDEGHYVILNVPVGVHRLNVNMIGYATMTVEQVQVSMDLTTTITPALRQEALLAAEEVTVIAERPLLRQDEFTSRHIVSGDDIEIQPVDNFLEVARNQAGVVGNHFRGGRTGEVLVLIDGIPLRDPAGTYSGNLGGFTADIPEHGIQELEVTLGGFSAEYGNVQSGILNLAMKEGSSKYSGSVRYTSTDFGPGLNDALMGKRDTWLGTTYRLIDRIDTTVVGTDVIEIDTTYIDSTLSNTYQHQLTNIYQFNLNGPEPIATFLLPIIGINVPGSFSFSAEITDRDQGYFLNQQSLSQSFQAKLTYKLSPNVKLSLGGLYSSRDWDQFYFPASKYGPSPNYPVNEYNVDVIDSTLYHYIYVTNPADYDQGLVISDTGIFINEYYDSVRTYYVGGMQDYLWNHHKKSQTSYVIWTHSLTPRTYYEIRFNHFRTNYHYATPDVEDRDGDGNTQEDLVWDITDTTDHPNGPWPIYRERESNYWWIRGDDPGYRDQSSWTNTIKADIVSQVTNNHMLKTGLEFSLNRTKAENISWTLNLGDVRKDIWDQNTVDIGAYIQDKMEFKGLIALVGLRFDYFDPNGWGGDTVYYPANYERPYTKVDTNDVPILENPQSARAKSQFSPRIGISYPITDRNVLYFTYGHYFQRPDGYFLYRNLKIQALTKVGNYIGNPDIKPEKTVSYEVGLEHLFTRDIKGTVTGFFKDITNLTNWHKYVGRTIQNMELNVFTNADYGNVKGLEFSLEKRMGRFLGGSVNYTYSIAKGRSSSVYSGSGAFMSSRRLNVLDFDQTQTVNANITLRTPEGPVLGLRIGRFAPFANWRANFQFYYGSGLPYSSYATGRINDERLPWNSNTDLRLNKQLDMFGTTVDVFIDVFNLFNRKNVDWIGSSLYYGRTGDPSIVRQVGIARGDEYVRNPQTYGDKRQFRFGFAVKF